MKLKTVHTYQTVRFNKRDETHFTAEKPTMPGLELEYDPKIHAVKISMPGAIPVLVFSTNVAYAEVSEPEAVVEPVKVSKAK